MHTPNAIIYIRDYKPLSLTMPSPGLYVGHVKIVLPDHDPTILSRLNEGGAGHSCVDLYLEKPVTANGILKWITNNLAELEAISRGVASPILPRFLTHLRRTKTASRQENADSRNGLVDLDNPFESAYDND